MIDLCTDIPKILEFAPDENERRMLEHFSGINSLVIDLEALALYRLCMMVSPGKRVLEIGSYRGGSTVAIGHAAIQKNIEIFCIDKWAEYHEQSDFINMDKAQLDDVKILNEFIHNTSFIKERLSMMRGEATRFSQLMGKNLFSMVFVDGAHDYFSVVDDIISALKVLEPGGILCGHDYHSAGVELKRAVHEVIMQSETISNKGLINNTSIWFAIIEDPEYELLLANTIRCMAYGKFAEALNLLNDGSSRFRMTAEIERIRSGLEQRVIMQPQDRGDFR
jgi:predicted O-methyltransferase YrrM